MKSKSRFVVGALFIFSALLLLSGCMTVSDTQTLVKNTNVGKTFNGKKVAVLPIKIQASVTTDSILPLRSELNQGLGKTLREKLPGSTIADMAIVADQLNQTGTLNTFEQLVATYENTGVIDKRHTAALGKALGSDFLLLSRLKAEKMDLVISRGMGASLEVWLIDANTGEVSWGGSGEWKRGGIYGAGKATPEDAAQSLLKLAFASLQAEKGSPQPTATSSSAPPIVEPPKQPTAPETATRQNGQDSSADSAASKSGKAAASGSAPKVETMPVVEIQQRLLELGYRPGPADGMMGKGTIAALRKFQRDNDLAVTGHGDAATIAKLREQRALPNKAEQPKLPREPASATPQKPTGSKVKSATDL